MVAGSGQPCQPSIMTAFRSSPPEFTAIILAATIGTRLFPMTSLSAPKHTLPIGGVAGMRRLLRALAAAGFREMVIGIDGEDTATVRVLQQEEGLVEVQQEPHVVLVSSSVRVTLVRLDECPGSMEAWRRIEKSNLVAPTSSIVIVPGDLVVAESSALARLVATHRQGAAALTMLLADVGETDEHGVPLKESAKQKKGGLARDEEEIEYMALRYAQPSSPPRVLWKQAKMDVEEDKDMVGTSPKVVLPKPRVRAGVVRVRTDWNDLHVYAVAPWVRQLVLARPSMVSLQGDLVPLLIARQFQGVSRTIGSKADKEAVEAVMQSISPRSLGKLEYSVLAEVCRFVLRAHSIPSFLYASKLLASKATDDDPALALPPGTQVKAKLSTIIGSDTKLGDKVNYKSSVIGERCKLGAKCRLNNVVLFDDVTIGDNSILQNSIIGSGAVIGENCNLNECQVGPGKVIAAGTKEKGESFLNLET